MKHLFMAGIGIVALSMGLYGWYQERSYKRGQHSVEAFEKFDKYTRFAVLDLECVLCNKVHPAVLEANFRPLWWLPTWVRERLLKAIVPKVSYSCGCEGFVVDDDQVHAIAQQFIRYVCVPVHCFDCQQSSQCIVEVSFEKLRWLPWRLRLLVVGSIIRCIIHHCGCTGAQDG